MIKVLIPSTASAMEMWLSNLWADNPNPKTSSHIQLKKHWLVLTLPDSLFRIEVKIFTTSVQVKFENHLPANFPNFHLFFNRITNDNLLLRTT